MTTGASGATGHSFRVGGVETLAVTSGRVDVDGFLFSETTGPLTPGGFDLGGSAIRWRTVYLVNSPNVSSDARLKEDIRDLLPEEIRAGQRLKSLIRIYRLKANPDKKQVGVIAQEVIAAFEAENLPWQDYGIVTGGPGAGDDGEDVPFGVNYDALLALVIAAL